MPHCHSIPTHPCGFPFTAPLSSLHPALSVLPVVLEKLCFHSDLSFSVRNPLSTAASICSVCSISLPPPTPSRTKRSDNQTPLQSPRSNSVKQTTHKLLCSVCLFVSSAASESCFPSSTCATKCRQCAAMTAPRCIMGNGV